MQLAPRFEDLRVDQDAIPKAMHEVEHKADKPIQESEAEI
jgi:hypothetical protein